MKKQTEAQAKRALRKTLTTNADVYCVDQKAYVTMLLLGLELALEGKTVANVHPPMEKANA